MNDRKEIVHPDLNEKADVPSEEFVRREPIRLWPKNAVQDTGNNEQVQKYDYCQPERRRSLRQFLASLRLRATTVNRNRVHPPISTKAE